MTDSAVPAKGTVQVASEQSLRKKTLVSRRGPGTSTNVQNNYRHRVPVPLRKSRESFPKPREQKLTGISPNLPLTHVSSLLKIQHLERWNRSVASSRLKIDFLTIFEPPKFARRLAKFPNWHRVTLNPEILDMVVGYKHEPVAPPPNTGSKHLCAFR